jgi:hypothetical protein
LTPFAFLDVFDLLHELAVLEHIEGIKDATTGERGGIYEIPGNPLSVPALSDKFM